MSKQFLMLKERASRKEPQYLRRFPVGWIISRYQPFNEINGFDLVQSPSGIQKYIISDRLGYMLRVKPEGYLPKSGLILCQHLSQQEIRNKTVLDIGTGETGILAVHCNYLGAAKVVACDIDSEAIQWASQQQYKNITWVVGDIFSGIENERFDVIVSNPPQLPMEHIGLPHDYGGPDGREYIKRIIREAPAYLNERGKLYLLAFDFLNVEKRYNSEDTIIESARANGFRCRIVGEYVKHISANGKTRNSLPWIKKLYPYYKFRNGPNGSLLHKIFVLKMSL